MPRSLLAAAALAALAPLLSSRPCEAARPFRGGAIASEHSEVSAAGLQMLEKGGNAADAAAAAAFALAVVAPYHSGLGGGGFALWFDARSGKTEALDFREVAPAKATREMFQRDGEAVPELSRDGGLSVGVPGAPLGYLTLLQKFGRLSPKVVLAPAIALAREGFVVTPMYRKKAAARLEVLRKDPEAARIFLRPNAQGVPDVPALGTRLAQPELARTLEALARVGASSYYTGPTARAIAESAQRTGGVLTLEDLARYQLRWRQPLEGSYRGHRVLTFPPPSAGGLAVVQVLAMMEAAFPAAPAFHDPEALHVFVESLRRVYVDRAKLLGDPAFVSIPLERLLSRDYLVGLLASIDRSRATPSSSLLAVPRAEEKAAAAPKTGSHTSHFSVIDREGNAVAMTTTVNYGFGSCVVAKGTGVLLNDQMDDFAAKPLAANVFGLVTGEANAVAPGKVPLSSMSPTFVFQKGEPKKILMAVGSPDGPTIPTTVMQTVFNVVDYGLDPARAVSLGRIHHQFMPDAIRVDRWGLELATARALQAKGHTLDATEPWGDAEAVLVDPETGLRYAGSDGRNEGVAAGQD